MILELRGPVPSKIPRGEGSFTPNEARREGDVVYLTLTGGMEAIIDAADYEAVSRYRWYASYRRGRVYVMTNSRRGDPIRKGSTLHGFLMPGLGTIDHINRNGTDCRRSNLRPANDSQNVANSAKRSATTTSKYKGVHWCKAREKWCAQIRVNYKRIVLGRFDLETDAAKAYDIAAREHFGEFARLNLP